MNNLSMLLNITEDNVNLFVVLGMFVSFAFLASRFNKYLQGKYINPYISPQRIHTKEVSRLGGLVMLVGVFMLAQVIENSVTSNIIFKFILAFSPLAALTLLEDLHIHINPLIRLATLLLIGFFILFFTNIALPVFSTPFLSHLLNQPFVGIIFFGFCIAGLINGMNFIDGTNGNLFLVMTSILGNLMYLGGITNDYDFVLIVILFFTPLFIFNFFNYPWGKIFAGDLGAYFYGASAGFLTIYFFGKNPDISSWNAILVVFYPISELIYSIVRKVLCKKSPLLPDRDHLHIKVYNIFFKATKNPLLSNNLVVIFLCIFWMSPIVILPWVYQSHLLLSLSLFALTTAYILINMLIPSESEMINKKNSK